MFGHTHCLNQLVPADVAFGLQRPGHEADHSTPLHFTSLHVATNSVCVVTPAPPETTRPSPCQCHCSTDTAYLCVMHKSCNIYKALADRSL